MTDANENTPSNGQESIATEYHRWGRSEPADTDAWLAEQDMSLDLAQRLKQRREENPETFARVQTATCEQPHRAILAALIYNGGAVTTDELEAFTAFSMEAVTECVRELAAAGVVKQTEGAVIAPTKEATGIVRDHLSVVFRMLDSPGTVAAD